MKRRYDIWVNNMDAHPENIKDKDKMMKLIGRQASTLKWASNKLRNDKELIFAATKVDKENFKYAGDKIRNDYTFIKEHPEFYPYAGDKIKKNKRFLIELMKLYPEDTFLLHSADESIRGEFYDNRETVLKQLENKDIFVFRYASDRLKDDKDIAMKAVKLNPLDLKYASDNIKNDKQIVLEAVKQEGRSLEFVSSELKKDREIVLQAINSPQSLPIEDLDKKFRFDKKIVESSMNSGKYRIMKTLEFADDNFKYDKILMLKAIKKDLTTTISLAPDEIKKDEKIFKEVLKILDGRDLFYTNRILQIFDEVIPKEGEDCKEIRDLIDYYYSKEKNDNMFNKLMQNLDKKIISNEKKEVRFMLGHVIAIGSKDNNENEYLGSELLKTMYVNNPEKTHSIEETAKSLGLTTEKANELENNIINDICEKSEISNSYFRSLLNSYISVDDMEEEQIYELLEKFSDIADILEEKNYKELQEKELNEKTKDDNKEVETNKELNEPENRETILTRFCDKIKIFTEKEDKRKELLKLVDEKNNNIEKGDESRDE